MFFEGEGVAYCVWYMWCCCGDVVVVGDYRWWVVRGYIYLLIYLPHLDI